MLKIRSDWLDVFIGEFKVGAIHFSAASLVACVYKLDLDRHNQALVSAPLASLIQPGCIFYENVELVCRSNAESAVLFAAATPKTTSRGHILHAHAWIA